MHFPKFKHSSMSRILQTLLTEKLSKHAPNIQDLARPVTTAILDIHDQCLKVLLPAPSQLYINLSLRHILRVIFNIAPSE